jgi:hypothetical protein
MKSKIFAVLLVLAGASFTYSQANGSRYIGRKYTDFTSSKALPKGVKVVGTWDIGDRNSAPAYGIAEVEKGNTTMLWLTVTTQDSTGHLTGWKVLDVLSFPVTARDNVFFFHPAGSPQVCTRSGKVIPDAAGVGRIVRKQALFRPSKLWVPDLATKKFKSVSPAGIKCE